MELLESHRLASRSVEDMEEARTGESIDRRMNLQMRQPATHLRLPSIWN